MGGLNGMKSYQRYFDMTVAGSSTGLGMCKGEHLPKINRQLAYSN